ncbi:hypothetical protein ACHAWF_010382 [Thalassiosira exigua]
MPPLHDASAAADGGDDPLLAELRSHNAFFDSVVNMIPAQLYVAGASGDGAYHPKYMKGQHKESKEARRARNKVAKRDKFDPERRETTLEAKKRVRREMEEGSGGDDDDDDNDDDDDDVFMSDGDGEEGPDGEAPRPEKAGGSSTEEGGEKSYSSRIEALRAKLHAKMAQKRAASAGAANGAERTPSSVVSKRAARRAEKLRRKEAAKERNKKRATSVAETREDKKRTIKRLGGSTYNAPEAAAAAAASSSSSGPTATVAEDLATIDYQPLAGLKPKLGGARDDKSLSGGKRKKKSLEHLLADAERKQARLKELKESGAEEDRVKARNIQWGEALKVAGGNDSRKASDPKLLKKAMKRKAKKKAASAKAWSARIDQAEDAAKNWQQIRAHNLDQRKLGGAAGANLSSKRIAEKDDEAGNEGGGKKEKRRRMGPHAQKTGGGANRAGFEGKKSGFINGDGGSASGGGGKKAKS